MQYAGILPSKNAVLAVVHQPLIGAPYSMRDFAVWVFLRAKEIEDHGREIKSVKHAPPPAQDLRTG